MFIIGFFFKRNLQFFHSIYIFFVEADPYFCQTTNTLVLSDKTNFTPWKLTGRSFIYNKSTGTIMISFSEIINSPEVWVQCRPVVMGNWNIKLLFSLFVQRYNKISLLTACTCGTPSSLVIKWMGCWEFKL